MVRIASVQFQVSRDIPKNVLTIISAIKEAARQGCICVAFCETAITGYFPDVIKVTTKEQINVAESKISSVCKNSKCGAIIGSINHLDNGTIENCATVINQNGNIVLKQPKLQLVPTDHWAVPGKSLYTFELQNKPNNIICSVQICHDIRHPEISRLAVLNGAKIIFYISWETWHDDGPVPLIPLELEPYRAQVQARAVENRVYFVHSNAGTDMKTRSNGSHGGSRIVAPTGKILSELNPNGDTIQKTTSENFELTRRNIILKGKKHIINDDLFECLSFDILVEDLDIEQANSCYAMESIRDDYFLKQWWKKCLDKGVVQHINLSNPMIPTTCHL